MSREILGTPPVTLPQLEARERESARELSSLEQRARGGEKDSYVTTSEPLQGFHPLPGNLGMRLRFAKSLTRGIQCHRQPFL